MSASPYRDTPERPRGAPSLIADLVFEMLALITVADLPGACGRRCYHRRVKPSRSAPQPNRFLTTRSQPAPSVASHNGNLSTRSFEQRLTQHSCCLLRCDQEAHVFLGRIR